jgi:hypothetical protein
VIRQAHPFQLRPFLIDLGALALVMLAPFVVLLSFHGYAYFAPEVLLFAAATVAAAALLTLLVRLAGPLVRVLVLAAAIALFVDMHVSLPTSWPSYVVTLLFLAAVAALAAILWLLREHATTILIVVFVTLIGLTLLRGSANSNRIVSERTAAAGSGNAEPPLLIHRCSTSTSVSRACRRRFRAHARCARSSSTSTRRAASGCSAARTVNMRTRSIRSPTS